MNRLMVKSSNVKSVGYDPQRRILEVEFKEGGLYQYMEVDQGIYDGLLNAPSKGSYLAQVVKPTYEFKKLDNEEEVQAVELKKETKKIEPRRTLIGESGQGYYDTAKFDRWVELFTDTKNKETFGNGTESALQTYGLDRFDPKEYATACTMGSQNFRKLKDLRLVLYSKKGVTIGKLQDKKINEAFNGHNKKWFDEVEVEMGIKDPPQTNTVIAGEINVSTQNNYMTNEELEEKIRQRPDPA